MSAATVEDLPLEYSHELGLGFRGTLQMQAPEGTCDGPRMILLHELHVDPGLGEFRLLVGFHEESAFVLEDGGLDDRHAWERGGLECKWHTRAVN